MRLPLGKHTLVSRTVLGVVLTSVVAVGLVNPPLVPWTHQDQPSPDDGPQSRASIPAQQPTISGDGGNVAVAEGTTQRTPAGQSRDLRTASQRPDTPQARDDEAEEQEHVHDGDSLAHANADYVPAGLRQ